MIELVIRIAFSLLVVFGIMWGLARLVRRPLAGRAAGPLSVLSRQQLSRGASVAVIRVGEQALVVGVTDQRVTLLAETPLATVEADRGHREPVSLDELTAASTETPVTAARGAHALQGSALSLSTWRQAVGALRKGAVR